MIRTFIAIELEDLIKQQISQIKDSLNWGESSIKWVKPENMHLTLRFLGDIKPKKVKAISNMLPEQFKNISPFNIEIKQLGAFPDLKRPKVIWMGLSQGEENVLAVARRLEEGLCLIGYPKEKRPFSSHITIGRVKSSQKSDKIAETIKGFVCSSPIKQKIETISFYQSTLTPSGPIYEPLAKSKLYE